MGRIVNKTELAEIFGITPHTIYTYTTEGMPIVKQGDKGVESEYDTAECIKWFAEKRLQKLDYNKERARLTKLQADKVQREIDLMDGETARIEDVKVTWEKFLCELKSQLLAMPNSVTPHIVGMDDPNKINGIILAKVKDILKNV